MQSENARCKQERKATLPLRWRLLLNKRNNNTASFVIPFPPIHKVGYKAPPRGSLLYEIFKAECRVTDRGYWNTIRVLNSFGCRVVGTHSAGLEISHYKTLKIKQTKTFTYFKLILTHGT